MNSEREHFDKAATSIRKLVESIFGMLEFRFFVLKEGLYICPGDDRAFLSTTCVLLQNLCIADGKVVNGKTFLNNEHRLCEDNESVTSYNHRRKRKGVASLACFSIENSK